MMDAAPTSLDDARCGVPSLRIAQRTATNDGEGYICPHSARFVLLFVAAAALFAVACASEGDAAPTPVTDAAPLSSVVPAAFATISSPAPAPASLPLDTGVSVNPIAYVTPDFEVFTVSPDGSDPVRVTPDPETLPRGGESDPIPPPGRSEVWVVSADGSTPVRSLGQGGLAFWPPR
jgi:hypothetical protein